jgi:DNA repair exonuclease SbcCD nuclease subunit
MKQLLKSCEGNNGVETIFHLSDIHIRLFQRHTEYQYIFEKCYQYIRKHKKGNHIIVVTGDIVHNKNDLSPECDTITIDFLQSLASIYPTLIIAGNHDALLNNRHRMDSITSMLYQRTIPNLYYMKHTGVYAYENILFFVDSLLDDDKLKLDDSDSTKIKIGLYHGQVSGWKNNYGFTTETGDKTLHDFDGLDYVLLGDIHKHQFMKTENPVVAYAGSMISQNFGESDEDHGVLLWDLISKTQKLHRFENPYRHQDITLLAKQNCYITDDKKYDLGDVSAMAKKGQIRVVGSDTIESKLILNRWREQLPKSTFHFNQNKKTKTENDIVEYENDECEKSAAKDYIQKNTTNDNFDTIYDYIMKKWEENDQFYKHVQWDIERIEFSNMFGYGSNNKILLSSKEPCTIGIFGENSCGKSTLIEIINILLFDKITRFSHGASIPKEVVNFHESKAKGMIELRIANDLYRIEKKFERQTNGKIKTSTKFFHISDGKKKELTGEQRKRTNKLIEEIVGKFDSFIYTNMFLQQRENNFREMTSAQKKRFLYELFGFQWFEKLEKEKKDTLKELEIEFRQQEKTIGNHSYEYWNDKIQNSNKKLTDLEVETQQIKDEKIKTQCLLKDLYCEMETIVEKEKEILQWKQYEKQNALTIKQYQNEMENAVQILKKWKDHFINNIPEDNFLYKEWAPCFQLKTLEEWNKFFQPFLQQEQSHTLVSLHDLYKKLSNYPEEVIDESILNIYPLKNENEKRKWIKNFCLDKKEVELKKLYCSLSHSMEELQTKTYFKTKKDSFETQLKKQQETLKELENRFHILSKLNAFWKNHSFEFYGKQHEMFKNDNDYQKYSPCFQNSTEWNTFVKKLKTDNNDYKCEIDTCTEQLKNIYETMPSYMEPVCNTSEYVEKVKWCEKNETCSCDDFFNEEWHEILQNLQETEQSINLQKMELELLKENDKLHPYVFNPECYACNENPFLENKKKNQLKIDSVKKHLEQLQTKKDEFLKYFAKHSYLKKDVHFTQEIKFESLQEFYRVKQQCLQNQQKKSKLLQEIQNYKNYNDYKDKKQRIVQLEKQREVAQKNYNHQLLWKEKEMMWNCLLFQRENNDIFTEDVFEKTKTNQEEYQKVEKELQISKENVFILERDLENFSRQWSKDEISWEAIQRIEEEIKEFHQIQKWLSMLKSKENQNIRCELLKQIMQAEHVQENCNTWKNYETILRYINDLWNNKDLWNVSKRQIEEMCHEADSTYSEYDKLIYQAKIDKEQQKEYHDAKMKQYERNKLRQEQIKKNESKLQELENVQEKYQEQIQQETIKLASIQESQKIWLDNVSSIEDKKKQIQAEKQIIKLLDKDGLPLHLLREKVKQMEIQMNDLISPFLDRKVQFFIDEKNIEFGTVFEEKPICHYFGGMESFILDLSLKLTFSKFSILPRPNFFIIDERISVLDQQRLYNISFLFQFISNLTTNVLLISHIPQVKDFVDKSIEIIKKNDKSYIQYCS